MGILDFLKAYQLDIMLVMAGICGALACLTSITAALSRKRKRILLLAELSAMLLLIFDRFSYIYRGDVSTVGFWMVRVCNFMVYFCTLFISLMLTLYLIDLYSAKGKLKTAPKRLNACIYLAIIGVVLLVISQFTGLYYSFDAQNQYQREAGNIISYVMPLSVTALQMSVILQYRKLLSHRMTLALVLNLIVPVFASIIQFFTYGVSLTNMSVVGMVIFLYTHTLRDLGRSYEQARTNEIESYKEANRREHAMFEQTAEALASAIDAKDEYTCGHSTRVAVYSQIIARAEGLPPEECERVYFAALLHDVGKIGVSDAIITKPGGLTDEEFAEIKRHPVYGYQILSNIQVSPYLSVGAHYHHERYDGRGYPEGLAGEDIPELARIIGVADAYDAMTSKRSYRDVRPQHLVRQEFVKGVGTQFDPHYAKIMLHLMDLDEEYYMHEQFDVGEVGLETELRCDAIYRDCSAGIRIVDKIAHIHLVCTSDEGYPAHEALPSLILFDSLDGYVHENSATHKDRRYFEYAQIRFDGQTSCTEALKIQASVTEEAAPNAGGSVIHDARTTAYDIEAVRFGDHMQVRIFDGRRMVQATVVLPFSGRFSYLSLTGEHCSLNDIRAEEDARPIDASYITRIAEEVNYIQGCPEGDIPNIVIDGERARTTQGILIDDTVRFTFHTQGLPNARLIWHCPFICLFTSQDGVMDGDGFKEFTLVRLDGEELEDKAHTVREGVSEKTQDFKGWDAWLEGMRQGMDCEVLIQRKGNVVTVATENLGIAIHGEWVIPNGVTHVYAALTGDQCTITNIRVAKG